MYLPPEPPPYATRICSDDVDEVAAWTARLDGDISRVVHGSGSYGFRAACLQGERVETLWGWNGLGHTLRGTSRQAFLQIPLTGRQEYRCGRVRVTAERHDFVFVAPGTELTRRCGPSLVFVVDLDPVILAEELRRRRPEADLTWTHYPRRLNVPRPLRLTVADAAVRLIAAHEPDAPSRRLQHCETLLVGRLADVLLESPPEERRLRCAIRRLSDLESWIDAHIDEPITLGRLCEVAGVGERSLQLAFIARRRMSPMRFVLERRLAAAHRRLTRGDAQDDVTSVATDLGFTHLGRFSIAYRDAYGEPPSHTMMRGRQSGAGLARSNAENG